MGVAVGPVFACFSNPRCPVLLKRHLSWGLWASEAEEQTSFLSELCRLFAPRRLFPGGCSELSLLPQFNTSLAPTCVP